MFVCGALCNKIVRHVLYLNTKVYRFYFDCILKIIWHSYFRKKLQLWSSEQLKLRIAGNNLNENACTELWKEYRQYRRIYEMRGAKIE